MQSISLVICKLLRKDALNLAHCSPKFAVLILVGQLSPPYFKVGEL